MNVVLILTINICMLVVGQSDEEIDYYKSLINSEITKSNNYKLPTDAKSYQGNYYSSQKAKDHGEYDFIIVGTGSTGAVLTGRLSEETSWKILVLEAGTWENNFTDIPSFLLYSQFSEYNWGFLSTPQKTACLAMKDQRCPYPRGKGVGGSTLLNILVYSRGNSKQFDIWNSLVDNGNWSYQDVLPYFKKSEDSHVSDNLIYHGFSGPLQVNYHTPNSPQYLAFIKANKELGGDVVDYNGKSELGVSKSQFNTIMGRRLSSERAFIFPALNRTNLNILPNSYVTKILINEQNEAYGVEFMINGIKHTATARKEVILSAGVFGSPTILMNSGIGPNKELISKGIRVRKNLPVGETLRDHAAYFGLFGKTNYTEKPRKMNEDIREYLKGVGPYTIGFNSQGMGFFETKYAKTPGVPDIEILLAPSYSQSNITQKSLGLTDNNYEAGFGNINPLTDFQMFISLLEPHSTGSVTLNSSNVFDYPLINPKYLSDKHDLDIKTMYEGIKIALDMFETQAFRSINASLVKVMFPACESYEYLTEEYWLCNIRQITFNTYHPVGTCRMGRHESYSVVDGNLNVFGIKHLRVADASVFPTTLSGHTSAPAMMIGEKLSDIIKKQYK